MKSISQIQEYKIKALNTLDLEQFKNITDKREYTNYVFRNKSRSDGRLKQYGRERGRVAYGT